jgi:hypothetical protein
LVPRWLQQCLATRLAHLCRALPRPLVTPQSTKFSGTARRRGGRILKWPVCTCKRRVRRLLCSRIAGSARLAHPLTMAHRVPRDLDRQLLDSCLILWHQHGSPTRDDYWIQSYSYYLLLHTIRVVFLETAPRNTTSTLLLRTMEYLYDQCHLSSIRISS